VNHKTRTRYNTLDEDVALGDIACFIFIIELF